MLLERSGNYLIKDIKINKKDVTIYFDNDCIKINKSTYQSFDYLYKGKELTNEEYDRLVKQDNLSKYLTYVYSLLSKNRYSEFTIKEKLLLKGAKQEEINSIISILVEKKLIDDDKLIEDIIDIDNQKLYGKYKILQKLKTKGLVPKNVIDSFPYEKELEKAKLLIEKIEVKYFSHSYNDMIRHIHNYLSNMGYETRVISDASSFIKERDQENELLNLEKDFKLAIIRHEKILDEYLLKNKVIKSLMAKGYLYNDILLCWEEYKHVNK